MADAHDVPEAAVAGSGDVNRDQQVDTADSALLAVLNLKGIYDSAGDMDSDVDEADLVALLHTIGLEGVDAKQQTADACRPGSSARLAGPTLL